MGVGDLGHWARTGGQELGAGDCGPKRVERRVSFGEQDEGRCRKEGWLAAQAPDDRGGGTGGLLGGGPSVESG